MSALAACLDRLLDACSVAEQTVEELREAIGKHRGKGRGIARLLRSAASGLAGALEACIQGCSLPGGEEPQARALRCGLGEAVEELQRSLHGVALRVERLPRLSGETEEELAEALLDTVAAALRSICGAARTAARILEEAGS